MYRTLYVFMLTDISRAVELLDKLQRTGEVPPQKLQALQRVLQSEFCNAVREVRHNLRHVSILDVIILFNVILSFFRFMSMCMKQWTSVAVLKSGPMPQPR